MHVHTRRTPREHEGGDHTDASTRKGMLKIISKPTEVRREAWSRFFLISLRENQTFQHLDLGRLAVRTVR